MAVTPYREEDDPTIKDLRVLVSQIKVLNEMGDNGIVRRAAAALREIRDDSVKELTKDHPSRHPALSDTPVGRAPVSEKETQR